MRLTTLMLTAMSGWALNGCIQGGSDDSSTKIVNGEEDAGHPEVKRLLLSRSDLRVCTGVAVSDSVMLLAGHCIESDLEREGITLEGGLSTKKVYHWSELKTARVLTVAEASYDIAAAVFPAGTFKEYARLAKTGPRAGDDVTLVGYGASNFKDPIANLPSGVKRKGQNRVSSLGKGVFTVRASLNATGPGNAVAAFGDSGGPVYNANNELVGIIAGLGLYQKSEPLSIGVNAKTEHSDFIQQLDAADAAVNILVDLSGANAAEILAVSGVRPQDGVTALSKADIPEATPPYFLPICGGGGGGLGPFGGGLGPLGGGSTPGGAGGSNPLGNILKLFGMNPGGGATGIGGQTPGGLFGGGATPSGIGGTTGGSPTTEGFGSSPGTGTTTSTTPGALGGTTPSTSTTATAATPKETFERLCASCHKTGGTGGLLEDKKTKVDEFLKDPSSVPAMAGKLKETLTDDQKKAIRTHLAI